MRALNVVACLLSLVAPLAAQGGGFASTDVMLYSPAIQGISSTSGALVKVDLVAGTAAILVDLHATMGFQGAMAFDPWRQRVVFYGSTGPGSPLQLMATDAAGTVDVLGLQSGLVSALAPTGDGRIYLKDSASAIAPLKYLDAAGSVKNLLGAVGTTPYLINGTASYDLRDMIYAASANALFVASLTVCPGGSTNRINVTKLPLSADGARVVGPESCAQFEVSASGETPVGWSHGPAGQLILVVDSNTNGIEPRILAVDPATLGISVFASPGNFFGDPAINAGTWCGSQNKVIVLETLTDVLRSYAAGSSGAGATLAITGTVSAAGSSGETATLHEIPASACAGGWLPYGFGLAGTGGFVPTLTGAGCPNIGSLFSLKLEHGVGAAAGTLFVGLAPTAVPFKGGSFYVGGVVLQVGITLGGTAGVGDAGSLTQPAGLPNDPLLQGVQVYLQALLQDVGAVKDVSMTNALRLEIG